MKNRSALERSSYSPRKVDVFAMFNVYLFSCDNVGSRTCSCVASQWLTKCILNTSESLFSLNHEITSSGIPLFIHLFYLFAPLRRSARVSQLPLDFSHMHANLTSYPPQVTRKLVVLHNKALKQIYAQGRCDCVVKRSTRSGTKLAPNLHISSSQCCHSHPSILTILVQYEHLDC